MNQVQLEFDVLKAIVQFLIKAKRIGKLHAQRKNVIAKIANVQIPP
jgi:hypothetical protein